MKSIQEPRLKESLWRGECDEGLSICGVPRPGTRHKCAVLFVDYGSVDRDLVDRDTGQVVQTPVGVAHFLEHRLFTKGYGDITERFNRLGADINASTSYTGTVFTMTCIENFIENIALLLDLVFDLHLSQEGIEREREVIARELRLGSDDPEWVGYFHGLKALYGEGPLARDMAGTHQSLEAIDLQILSMCHDVFYRPQHMGLYLCGDIDLDTCRRSIDRRIGQYQRSAPRWQRVERPVYVPAPQAIGELALPIVRPYALYFFGDDRYGVIGRCLLQRELALELALDIAFGPASDFFAKHYGNGLIDGDAFGCEVYAEPTFCFCVVGGYTDRSEQLYDEIRATLAGLDDLVKADFARAKRKAYGQLLRSFEQAEQVADLLCSAIVCKAEPFDYVDVYNEMTDEFVLDCLSGCLTPERVGVVRINPSGGLG